MKTRTEVIQSIIDKYQYKSYAEIGVQWGNNFNAIQCEHKVGVDPDTNSAATIFKTSDDFFRTNTGKFDCFFNDGWHEHQQLKRDILNSLDCLNPGGTILAHDCLPTHPDHQNVYVNGTCWKAIVDLRMERDDLEIATVDTDFGCCIIRRGSQVPLKIEGEINWDGFAKNKQSWVNIISVAEFKQRYL